jgi:2-methylcitrate dehydratase PrpD
MRQWLGEALQTTWPDWDDEETIKAKLLFLDWLGQALAGRGDDEAVRLAEHLEAFGGEEQAMLFAVDRMVPAPLAACGNGALQAGPLLFPVVLALIEQQNKGGKELVSALIAGLEASYRMGDHEGAEWLGALVGAALACELDEDGWEVLLGLVLPRHQEVPTTRLGRGLAAQDLVVAAGLARDEWSAASAMRGDLPESWWKALERSSGKPGLKDFLMVTEINSDEVINRFRERTSEIVPKPHLEYYVDVVMAMEDICCIPLFYRR